MGSPRPPIGALTKHRGLDALMSHAEDPHPRRTRRVEWIGEMSPFDNPLVQWRLLMGQYTPTQTRAIRKAAAQARTRVCRNRLFEADHQHAMAVVPGLRRTYMWTKENDFIQDVDWEDYDRIFGSTVAHEFRDLELCDPDEPAFIIPPVNIIIYDRDQVAVGSHNERSIVART